MANHRKLGTRIPKDLHQHLRWFAKREEITMSILIQGILEHGVDLLKKELRDAPQSR